MTDSRNNSIPQAVALADPVLRRLEEAGFSAHLVGGSVRDILMSPGDAGPEESLPDKTDLDVTTEALPEEVCNIFSPLAVIGAGLAHGTVTVLLPVPEKGSLEGSDEEAPRIPVEITTWRKDGNYSDGRHPDQVRFVSSLEEDLARRDFTINAIAMDRRGDVVDPFGGREDLKKKLIRAVGDPQARFREDGLRILRALRFASVLGFDLVKETDQAVRDWRELLDGISAERVYVELKKLLTGQNAGRILREYTEVLGVVLPELLLMEGFAQNNPYHRYDVLEHGIRALETVKTTPENREYMKWTALFHDVGKPSTYTQDEMGIGHFYGHPQAGAEILRDMMKRLKADRATADRIVLLVKQHDLVFDESDRTLKRWMGRFTPQVLLEVLAIKRADNIATGNVSQELLDKFDRVEERICQIRDKGECLTVHDLAVDGKDLMDVGIPEGPRIGAALSRLLDQVIDGELPNEREALLKAIRP